MIPISQQTIRLSLSCPTFVPKHGDLGRTKAGWLPEVFASHLFLYFLGPYFRLFFHVGCSKGGWLATQSNPPGSAPGLSRPEHCPHEGNQAKKSIFL